MANESKPVPDPMKADLSKLSLEQLLETQHAVSALRSAVIGRGRQVQAELDRRAEGIEEERRRNAALLGQVNRPLTQSVLGD